MWKRVLFIFFILFALTGMTGYMIGFGVEDVYAETTQDGFIYGVSKDGTVVVGGYEGKDTKIAVPEEIEGKQVTGIGWNAFREHHDLESITLPSGIKIIGECAFYGCENIKTISMSEGVNVIEQMAFLGCRSLQKVTLPSTVKSIGERAFQWCENLEEITIPEQLDTINDWVFLQCGFTSLVIPDNVKYIGEGAFAQCKNAKSVSISKGITQINGRAFECWNSLEFIEIPEGVEVIKEDAFRNCLNLTAIALPLSVKQIEKGAFDECDSLSGVYYAGSESQWAEVSIEWSEGSYAERMKHASVYCNKKYENKDNGASKTQEITCKMDGIKNGVIKYDGNNNDRDGKEFFLNASSSEYGIRLSYESSNKKVVSVDDTGHLLLNGSGVASVTVKAAAQRGYQAASKTLKFVILEKVENSVKQQRKNEKVVITWKKMQGVSGYQYSFAYNAKFTNDVKGNAGKKNKITLSGFQTGYKTIYVRIRAYVKVGNKTYYGDWGYPESFSAPNGISV